VESGVLYSGVAAEKEKGRIRGPVLRGDGRDRERGNRSSIQGRLKTSKGESGGLYPGMATKTVRRVNSEGLFSGVVSETERGEPRGTVGLAAYKRAGSPVLRGGGRERERGITDKKEK
jgi:hypothetical protein